jgi:hypothetical protein
MNPGIFRWVKSMFPVTSWETDHMSHVDPQTDVPAGNKGQKHTYREPQANGISVFWKIPVSETLGHSQWLVFWEARKTRDLLR